MYGCENALNSNGSIVVRSWAAEPNDATLQIEKTDQIEPVVGEHLRDEIAGLVGLVLIYDELVRVVPRRPVVQGVGHEFDFPAESPPCSDPDPSQPRRAPAK